MFGLHLGLGTTVATPLGLMYPNWTRQHYLGLCHTSSHIARDGHLKPTIQQTIYFKPILLELACVVLPSSS